MFVSQPFAASVIKSIQRGMIAIAHSALTNTATITAVTTSKTALANLGHYGAIPTDAADMPIGITLTNTTTITATRGDNHTIQNVSFQAVEYN